MKFLEKIFGKGKSTQRGTKRYDEEKNIAQSSNVAKRLSLAANTKTNQEILYYLADHDPDPKVRMTVLENEAMPLQASRVLAQDPSEDVRLALAKRLVELLPDLSAHQHSKLYAYAVQALGTLALDEVLKVRKALSTTLKDYAMAPPKVAGQLARDVEREVSEPILKYCAALPDTDLLDILADHPEDWVVEAIAGRKSVSEDVSEAVIDLENLRGGKTLLENDGAKISEGLLHYIIDKARNFPEWHAPMAMRKRLPLSVAREMAEFVDDHVYQLLIGRNDFNEETTKEVAHIFRRRVDFASEDAQEYDAEKRLKEAIKNDEINYESVSDALAMRDYPFLCGALAHLSGLKLEDVKRIFETKAARPIVALTWKAGLNMRMALRLQQEIGHVQPRELIYPKGGTDYPMTTKELEWQFEFLGIDV